MAVGQQVVVLETALVTALRVACFFLCQRIVLNTLYSDLQKLSTTSASDDEVPLQNIALPVPSTTPRSNLQDDSVSNRQAQFARWCFALCFAESCALLLLFICQLIGVLSTSARSFNSTWSISALILLVLVAVPSALLTMVFTGTASEKLSWKVKTGLISVTYMLYLVGITHVPLPKGEFGRLTSWLARLLAIGTVFLGILSAVGVVRTSWESIVSLASPKNSVTQEDIDNAGRSLSRVRSDLEQRVTERDRRSASPTETNSSFVSRWFKTDASSSLRHEINGLESLEYHMSTEYDRLCEEFEKSKQGLLSRSLGYLFAFYCLLRVASSIRNLLFRKPAADNEGPSSPDFAAQFIAFVFSKVDVDVDASALAHQLSLLFVGILIALNIRVILRECTRFLKLTGKHRGASFMILLCTQLMGVYILATLIQLISSFPPPPNDDGTPASSGFWDLPSFHLFSDLFDISFLVTTAVHMAVKAGIHISK